MCQGSIRGAAAGRVQRRRALLVEVEAGAGRQPHGLTSADGAAVGRTGRGSVQKKLLEL